VDIRGLIPLPQVGEVNDKYSCFEHVYASIDNMKPITKKAVMNQITATKWHNTVNHEAFGTCYAPKADDKGYHYIEGREKLCYKPMGESVPDGRLVTLVEDLNATASKSKMFGMWYHALSFQTPVKSTIECVQFVKRYAGDKKCDLVNLKIPMSFAATWTNSGFKAGPCVGGGCQFPEKSTVQARDALSVAVNDICFYFGDYQSYPRTTNDDTRRITFVNNISALKKKLLSAGYKTFFVRVPLAYFEIDNRDDFLALGLGMVSDIDPISGFVWITNDKKVYKSQQKEFDQDKIDAYAGQEKFRDVLRHCLGARFMVNQTHVGFAGFFALAGKVEKVAYLSTFQQEKDVSSLVGGELIVLDPYLGSANLKTNVKTNKFGDLGAQSKIVSNSELPQIFVSNPQSFMFKAAVPIQEQQPQVITKESSSIGVKPKQNKFGMIIEEKVENEDLYL
jgi:hypothetical protein